MIKQTAGAFKTVVNTAVRSFRTGHEIDASSSQTSTVEDKLWTRRGLYRLFERTWLALFLVPWRATAQNCSGCPNFYFSCAYYELLQCNSYGVFILGCPISVGFQYGPICGYCADPPYDPACGYSKSTIPATCNGTRIINTVYLCCYDPFYCS